MDSWRTTLKRDARTITDLPSYDAEALDLPDGRLAAVCPACGSGTYVERIPVLTRCMAESEMLMALACSGCGANLTVRARLYRLAT